MAGFDDRAHSFLAMRRIAVAGASRNGAGVGNLIYRKLRETGHEVFAIHPQAESIEGDAVYRSIAAIPDGVEGVVITTAPAATATVVRDCIAAGVRNVWIHRAIGRGSHSAEAVRLCRENGVQVLAGACPMMYCAPVDLPHRCFHFVMKWTGGLPKG